MGESPLFAGWKTCPRCRHDLEQDGKSLRCSECGLSMYANPAPTASALLLESDSRVLLARRAGPPGVGLWDLLGGFVEEGEEVLAALRREIREETALEIEVLDFLGAYPDRYGPDGIYTLNLYWTARITGGELDVDKEELAEVAWFDSDELPAEAEFAFANTVRALADWKLGLGSAERKK